MGNQWSFDFIAAMAGTEVSQMKAQAQARHQWQLCFMVAYGAPKIATPGRFNVLEKMVPC